MTIALPPKALERSRARSNEARLTGLIEPTPQAPRYSEAATRELCRTLSAIGFDVEYLERRYNITRKQGVNA